MNKKIKLILAFPFYLVFVLIACVIALPISTFHLMAYQAYYNPFKLGWYYINGKPYKFKSDEFDEMVFFSPLLFFCLLVIVGICVFYWKQFLICSGCLAFIIVTIILSKFVVKELFEKGKENE